MTSIMCVPRLGLCGHYKPTLIIVNKLIRLCTAMIRQMITVQSYLNQQ